MLYFFLTLFISVIAVESCNELLTKSVFFSFIRDFLAARKNLPVIKFFYKIVSCPYCSSVWVSFFICGLCFLGFYISGIRIKFTDVFVIDYFLLATAVHRLSNHFHNFCDKHLDKFYRETKEKEEK